MNVYVFNCSHLLFSVASFFVPGTSYDGFPLGLSSVLTAEVSPPHGYAAIIIVIVILVLFAPTYFLIMCTLFQTMCIYQHTVVECPVPIGINTK